MNTTPNIDEPRFIAAFVLLKNEIEAVPPESLPHMNVDLTVAPAAVLAAEPGLAPYRPRAAALPEFEMKWWDRLEDYTLALAHAQSLCAWESKPNDGLVQQLTMLTNYREIFQADVEALAKRNLLSSDQLKKLRGAQGYRNVAWNVLDLTAFLRAHWSTIAGKCGLTPAEIDAAAVLAERVVEAIAMRERAVAAQPAAVLLRDKAFALWVRAHHEVRRALTFLLDDSEKVEELMPSLYAGRGTRPPKEEEKPAEDAADAPVQPVVTPNTPAGPTNGTPAAPVAPVPGGTSGMPGGNPTR